jgi:hypothetical protein
MLRTSQSGDCQIQTATMDPVRGEPVTPLDHRGPGHPQQQRSARSPTTIGHREHDWIEPRTPGSRDLHR